MNNEEEVVGIYAEDMSVADLKQLCKENNLDIKGKTNKKDILEVVHAWEKTIMEKTNEEITKRGATSVKKNTGVAPVYLSNVKAVEFHEGKLVTGKVNVTLNGVEYTDITVEGGVTHRVPVIK